MTEQLSKETIHPSFDENSNAAENIESANKKRPIYQKILMMMAIMFTIGGSLTGVMTFVNNGFTDVFFILWFKSFIVAALLMMPSGFIVMTLLTRLVNTLLPKLSSLKENLIIGILMALFMESLMAGSTSFNSVGFSDMSVFASTWVTSFLYALPLGMVIAIVMTLTFKPKLQKFMAS